MFLHVWRCLGGVADRLSGKFKLQGVSETDMQKHPSSLAVLAEIFLALAEIYQKDPVVLQGYWWKAETLT